MKHRSLEILEDLIRIQSVNPHYGDGARGERELSDYIEQRFANSGLKVYRQQVFPGRDNIVIELRTGRSDNTLLFEAHMDTVSLGSMENPLVPTYRDDRLYGRGACDTKGSLASMIYMMEECAKHPEKLDCDIVLCASVDEEHAYRGLMAFLELNMPATGVVVGEPTEMRIAIAHKGCLRFAVETHGKAAHTSVAHEGNNAIYQMQELISHIHNHMEPRLAQISHPLVGSPSIVVATIQGGKQVNVVPESCVIEIDRRLIPGEDPDAVMNSIRAGFDSCSSAKSVKYSIKEHLRDWPLDTPHDSKIVHYAQLAARQLGLNGDYLGVPYGSDASKFQQLQGIPSIVFGPGSIAQAHSKEEWVSVKEMETAAEFYLLLAQNYGK